MHASRRRLLEAMVGYCHATGCLRRYILNYFGEDAAPAAPGQAPSVRRAYIAFGEAAPNDGTAPTGGASASVAGCNNCSIARERSTPWT